ncbi:serine threonine kinase fungal-specific transcription factor [Pseudocercospora fijiensis CIRAD86]|uniref:Serine threonine kinase fungal-specific transcription factor n=1 Tax=Pseudocercospora fijiensis (strain CIRAD86) TaxID=383855 RepID=M3ANA4_PSEFD|nr:serine threonine kinase fungal-specific transcription factor [Pseudocercospora fijiensis CIRAD86]EME78957.1 serine threonine kinase fungal-specific transcription factor [Pseudocercospora fijiensis CIRAD86]
MRSSIACIRCRRSKVKCVNNGVGTTCRSCENSGRECTYPSPVAGGTRRRDSISGRADVYGDAERRQRPRKSTHTFVANPMPGSRESPRPLLDALDARLLTPQVWQELFDIFQIHYSADLPFLHPPTFLKPLRQSALQPAPPTPAGNTPTDSASTARPPASTEFLLAFLALTARFHPKLVQHHSPPTANRASNPLIASEYYAAAANERLASIWTDNRNHDIERTQAALMLGLHEWGMCRGSKAWLTVGMAIRAAQSMGLQYELDLDDEPLSRSLALSAEAERLGMSGESSRKNSTSGKSSEDLFIQQEIRRRTFWSCFIMDRYLSSGKYRPQMLHARELRIQLPASERSFLFAEKVRTLMLGEDDKGIHGTGRAEIQSQRQQQMTNISSLIGTGTPEPNQAPSPRSIAMRDDDEKGRLEVGSDEGLVSRYIKILEIYGKVIRWSCSGGRRVEEHPPWDSRCEFYRLRRQCQEFKAALPRQHSLTPQNTQAHISLKTSTPYTLVHTVYLLCQIMLHREYVPFIPIRCSKPEGPMDPPTFPPEKYHVPPGFWEESARECFRSAREIMDLVRTCQEWCALVETPIVGFAVYTVAFVGVYCINFPWMDPEGYMGTRPEPNSRPDMTAKPGESKGFEAARKALEMIGMMRTKLRMADGWFKTINRMHKYFRKIKNDYKKNVQAIESSSEGDSPISTRHLSLREGGLGGGLDEYKLLERTLIDFGNLEDQDVEMTDANRNDPNKPLDAVYDDSSPGTTVKSEEHGDRLPAATSEPQQKADGGAWSAINAGPGAPAAPSSRHPSTSTPSSGQFRSYDSYPHQQHSQPPQAAIPSSQAPPQPGSYQHQIGGFRPSYSDRPSPSAGPPPSLTSPASQSATGTTPSQAHPSPPYDRHAPAYGACIDTRLGGDDVAAFVDGGELAEWANMAASQGFGGGWLSAVWQGGHA